MSADRPKSNRPGSKISRIWKALRRRHGLNSFEAYAIGDTVLPSTVFQLRRAGFVIHDRWETVTTRHGAVKFKRYFAHQPKGNKS